MTSKYSHNKNCAAIILAAGQSSRMGYPKPFLPYNDDLLFIEKIIEEYFIFGCCSIVVVHNDNERWKPFREKMETNLRIALIKNKHLEFERFYSVKIGLQNLLNEKYCFVSNADNPFINQDLLKSIYSCRNPNGFTVPVNSEKGGHPILLSRKIIDSIILRKENSANLKNVLSGFERNDCKVDDERILININDRKDYSRYFSIDIDEHDRAKYV